MFFKLILLFTITPIIELFLLLQLSKVTSVWTTIGIVLTTGIVGAYLAKSEGKLVLSKIRTELNYGRIPGNELLNGLCILIGGALLLTPGLITDTLGFVLVIPGTREIFKSILKRKFKKMIESGNIYFHFRR
ncbi:FxsA cytoplasmic membrane protein [Caloranaerobacter sp. TR13]|uniref:FxsA family protein n=1 Tax=Caloranaerobacter sp. TR13 TaxID=1302151 RepID=UPI0006D4080C|nr:FxsA family protein [Caloranaerobacter sp. TR13]KPU26941.1 FxsA cytoplasmic membrane protein [Caloranaerobacter sp. TR13]